MPPALLAVVIGAGVLGGHGEDVPTPSPATVARAVAVASANVDAPAAVVASPVSDPLAAAHAVDGQLGQTLIPSISVRGSPPAHTVLLAVQRGVNRFTIDDSVFALATPPRRSDWPRAVASPYLR